MLIRKFYIRKYIQSKFFDYVKLKDRFSLDIFWITIIYPVYTDWHKEYFGD